VLLRRLRAHGRDCRQDGGRPIWIADCPAHEHRGGPFRIEQHTDGTVTVHPCRSHGQAHTGAEVIAALAVDDKRVIPFDRPAPLFQDPRRPRFKRTGPVADSFEIFERLTAALVDGGYDEGRGRTGRFRCPACGAKGDGHGLKVDHAPNAAGTERKILLVGQANRCPVEEILTPLEMTVAELCAGDDVDDLGEEDEGSRACLPNASGGP
jgi:hypothetical protein